MGVFGTGTLIEDFANPASLLAVAGNGGSRRLLERNLELPLDDLVHQQQLAET